MFNHKTHFRDPREDYQIRTGTNEGSEARTKNFSNDGVSGVSGVTSDNRRLSDQDSSFQECSPGTRDRIRPIITGKLISFSISCGQLNFLKVYLVHSADAITSLYCISFV